MVYPVVWNRVQFFGDNNTRVYLWVITKKLHTIPHLMASHLNEACNPFLPWAILFKICSEQYPFLQKGTAAGHIRYRHDLPSAWQYVYTCTYSVRKIATQHDGMRDSSMNCWCFVVSWSKQTMETESTLHRYGYALAWDNALRFHS